MTIEYTGHGRVGLKMVSGFFVKKMKSLFVIVSLDMWKIKNNGGFWGHNLIENNS